MSEQYDPVEAEESTNAEATPEGVDEATAEAPADEPTPDSAPQDAPVETAAAEATDTPEGADLPLAEDSLAEDDAAEDDPLEAFRRELWAKPGDWFVVHTYSGMENRVKSNLENRIVSLNMEDYIHEIVVPIEDSVEIKNGQRRVRKKPALPGYVLVRMDLTDESWAAVRHTPSVTGFVGHSHQPVPLSMAEVENMLAPAVVQAAEVAAAAAAGGTPAAGGAA
ncbi:MAG: transcription termination/antitermination NusG family protein, partial [Nocardioides sp.]